MFLCSYNEDDTYLILCSPETPVSSVLGWHQPARLWGQRLGAGPAGKSTYLVAEGPLEELVLRATTVDPARCSALVLECARTHDLLLWDDIQLLRAAPDFPVEI
jgi:hypothetical protein